MTDNDEEISTTEAAAILKCSERTIRYLIERGSLKARVARIDPNAQKGRYRVLKKDILEIKKQTSR